MLKSIRYELNPTRSQLQGLNQTFGNCRFIYNWALDKKIKAYSTDKTTLSGFDLMKEITQLKKEDSYNWLNLSGATQLQQSILNLDTAFTNFFKAKKDGSIEKKKKSYISNRLKKGLPINQDKLDNIGKPKFKSKHDKQSFRIPQDVKINYENYKFYIPKVGWVKFYKDRQIDGVIKFATITKTSTGRIFISVTYETQEVRKTGIGVVGVDLGIKDLTITSDGEVFENQKHLKSNLAKLRVEQRKLQRKYKKGSKEQSKNYYKQKLVVSKLYEKITFQRKDYLHKITTYLASTYETVCIEDLNVSGMLKNKNLSLAISDMGWGTFRSFLEYKVKDLRVIGRFESSSKTCSVCGTINKELKLSDRKWTCSNGHVLDRDINAAINIKNFGLRASTFDVKVEH